MDYGLRYRSGVHATPTSFVDPAAVEAWDAWFRWREGNELRDVTIDATWSRVVGALLCLESGTPACHEQRLGDAIGSWRLLMDCRILARAGTPGFAWPRDDVVAAVNLARFVSLPFTPKAMLQADALADTIDLALRLLDDVRGVAGDPSPGSCAPRLGIVGLADALAMLGHDYVAPSGVACASIFGRLFAQGVADASVRLARERGAADGSWRDKAIERAGHLGLAAPSIRQMRTHGLRFGPLSALMSLPRLALVANNVADAAQPLGGERQEHVIAGPGGERRITASGFAPTLWRQLGAKAADAAFPFSTSAEVSFADRAHMHAVVAPWFDHADVNDTAAAIRT
jgi:ribonucleoside-diphosphate reductase alpha chain